MTASTTLKAPDMERTENTRSFPSYAILILCLSASFLLYKYILQNFPSVISSQLMTAFHLQGLGLGMLSGVYFWTYLIVPLFVGVIIDRYGTRWISSAAILSCAIGVYIFAQVSSLPLAVLARALIGVGVSFATITYMKLAATWFPPKRYALLVGLLVSAAMLGAICGQMPFAWLVQSVGWRQALTDIAIAGLVLTMVFMLVVRDAPQEASTLHIKDQHLPFSEIMQVFKNKQNWLLFLYSGLSFSPIVIFGGLWGNPFLQGAYQIDALHASSFISLIFIGLGVGGPAFALLSTRFKQQRGLMIYTTLASALSMSLVLYCHPLPSWLLSALLFNFGFCLGAFSMVFVIGKNINPLKLAGTAMAMINASEALLDAITEPLIGKWLDVLGSPTVIDGIRHFPVHSYHWALAILPIYQIVGSALLLWVKEK